MVDRMGGVVLPLLAASASASTRCSGVIGRWESLWFPEVSMHEKVCSYSQKSENTVDP